jgi:hypothetical protein
MGIFFSDSKPKVTRDEFKKVCNDLYYKDWTHKDLELLKSFFDSSINETKESDRGLDANEIMQGIKNLREHEGVYRLSEKKIDALQEVLNKYL